MTRQKQLSILREGAEIWNKWRTNNQISRPDFSFESLNYINLEKANLIGAVFIGAKLAGAKFAGAQLIGADFGHAVLNSADLQQTILAGANFISATLHQASLADSSAAKANFNDADMVSATLDRAKLNGASFRLARLDDATLNSSHLVGTDFLNADLVRASLRGAFLSNTNLTGAHLEGADFGGSEFGDVLFGYNDLSKVSGLETVVHRRPSRISIDTLFRSGGQIPHTFLLGCGVPESFIPFIQAHIGAEEAIKFYSCFISHSHRDQEFVDRLFSRLRDAQVRVWYSPESVKGGDKLYDQIDQAIRYHDKLLIVLSKNSMTSEWVLTEIRKARKAALETKRKKLFPISLLDYETLKGWECFDADSGKDLAVELREYYIPDFSNWKQYDAFEKEFRKLLRDLQSSEGSLLT